MEKPLRCSIESLHGRFCRSYRHPSQHTQEKVYWNRSVKNIAKGNTEIVAEFNQKTVGGGPGSCERDLKKICKGASLRKGLAIHGADAMKSESAVASWAKKEQRKNKERMKFIRFK